MVLYKHLCMDNISFDEFRQQRQYSIVNMKQFSLSDDRIVIVKKSQEQRIVIVKQKDSDVKCAELTPNR